MVPDINEIINDDRFELLKGSLLDVNKRFMIPYWPLAISRLKMSLLTPFDLDLGDTVYLSNSRQQIILRVSSSIKNFKDTNYSLISLMNMEKDCSIEAILRNAPELRRWNHDHEMAAGVRLPTGHITIAARFATDVAITIHAKTFGTRGYYVLHTQNISKSGMLVKEVKDEPTPFTLNTIVELTIDPDGEFIEEPLQFLAKVIRSDKNKDTGEVFYALKLLDLDVDAETLRSWSDCVAKIEDQMIEREAHDYHQLKKAN